MKKVTAILALVGMLTVDLVADAVVDAQIEAIQNAPAAEKVQLMNEFKQQLMTMNQEQRKEAVAAMQAEIQATGEMTQAQIQERTRARENQLEATQEMIRTEQMNQLQIANQYMKGINSGEIPRDGAGIGTGKIRTH